MVMFTVLFFKGVEKTNKLFMREIDEIADNNTNDLNSLKLWTTEKELCTYWVITGYNWHTVRQI